MRVHFKKSDLWWTVAACWLCMAYNGVSARPESALTAAQLYQLTNVWTAHFTFSPEQWNAMEPSRPERSRPNRLEGGPGGPNLTGPSGGRNGLAAVRGLEFHYVQAELEIANSKFQKAAVRYKGNGTYFRSLSSLKRSLKVDLNDTIKGQKLAGETKLNFHSNVSDPSWMLEPLSYRFYRDAGVPAPRTSYVKVYLSVPGEYQRKYVGLYSLVENIDGQFLKENFGTKDGAIFKPVGPSLFEYKGEDWARYQQQYDPKTDLTPAQSKKMIDFCKLITSASDQEFAQRIASFVDLDEFSRFMAATVCLSSLDSILGMGQNFYMVLHPKSNKFLFIPWDLDNSFGKFRMVGTQEGRENLSIWKPWHGQDRFIERMFQVEDFKKFYKARLQEFSQKLFRPDRLGQQVDELARVLRSPIREESPLKLQLFDQAAAGEKVPPDFDGGRGGWMNSPITPIKPFVAARAQSLRDQLAGRSEGTIVTRRFGRPDR